MRQNRPIIARKDEHFACNLFTFIRQLSTHNRPWKGLIIPLNTVATWLETMNNLFSQYKTCASCRHEDQREIPEEIAAFEERRDWTVACPKCGSKETTNAGVAVPAQTRELMEIWSRDESLSFYEQDEDIILAEEENIDFLLEYLDSSSTLSVKKSILLAALCVLIHDNVPEDEEDDPDIKVEIADRVASELKERIVLFTELDTRLIMDYVKQLAYPKIGLL